MPITANAVTCNPGYYLVSQNVPAGYTELEYIESTGTQYIDTGYYPNSETKVETRARIMFDQLGDEWPMLFGAIYQYDNNGNKMQYSAYNNAVYFFYTYGPRNYGDNDIVAPLSVVDQMDRTYIMDKNGVDIDGTIYSNNEPPTTFNIANTMLLFARNEFGTPGHLGKARIYYFKIYDNNILVRNFIPARRNSDNAVGMYDTVTNSFFTNDGTGTFVAGADVGTCELEKFSVTTTNDTTSLSWTMTATGTFYVDCGDGGTLSQTTVSGNTTSGNTITRGNTTSTEYTCTWSAAGAHTVRFGGTATGYVDDGFSPAINFGWGGTAENIASVSGNMSAVFPYITANAQNGAQPRFRETFTGATNLTSISPTLFANYTTGAQYMFSYTFNKCTSLQAIPSGLFSSIRVSAAYLFHCTFAECGGITSIPANLFSNITTGADYMFWGTFYKCTGLTSVPSGLFSALRTGGEGMFFSTFSQDTSIRTIPSGMFSNITTSAPNMFTATFLNNTSLTNIPNDLFSGITAGSNNMFELTFSGCTSLNSIPANLFSGITSPAQSMFEQTFYSCSGLNNLPSGLFSRISANGSSSTYRLFADTFNGCTGLTTIPSGLFQGVNISNASSANDVFANTFYGCTGLISIPDGLFSGIDTTNITRTSGMFRGTFEGCTSLRFIPSGLFSSINTSNSTNTSSMFSGTFSGCTALTSMPDNLFAGIDNRNAQSASTYMFYRTFYGCSNMTGYIPPTTFPNTIQTNSSGAAGVWEETFTNTALATSCPNNMQQYITGYESDWNGKVSCYCPSGGLYNDTCHARCPYGDGELHVGQYTHPLWADITNVPSPSVYIGELGPNHDGLCYAYLEPDDTPVDNHHGFHTVHNGVPYHAINLGLYGLE